MGRKTELWCDLCGKKTENRDSLCPFTHKNETWDVCQTCQDRIVARVVAFGGLAATGQWLRPCCPACQGKGYTLVDANPGQAGHHYDKPEYRREECRECKL